METALYFPLMRVPETPWFTQVLLYWDKAATIDPRPFSSREWPLYGPQWLPPYTYELVRAGLVQPLEPYKYIGADQGAFDEDFLMLLEEQQQKRPSKFKRGSAARIFGFEPLSTARIHRGKGSRHLFHELQNLGLARPATASWWEVEKLTANLYMAFLAGSICRENEGFFPVTDKVDALSGLSQPDDGMRSQFLALRYMAISQALPIPSEPVSASELASFKDRYGDRLHRLRCYLDEKLVDLAVIEDDFLRSVKMESVLQEIRDDVAVLTEQMSKRRWPRVVLVGIGGVLASALTVGTAIAAGGTALALGLGVSAGIASMGPAGVSTVDVLRSSRFDGHSPLAYAALAQAL
jgi:hypothetical protein